MKILQTKITNITAYLLLVFAIASVSLLFYGQFSNLEFETLNNTSTEVTPIVDNNNIVNEVVGNSEEMVVEYMPSSEVMPTTPGMESDMLAEPIVEETTTLE